MHKNGNSRSNLSPAQVMILMFVSVILAGTLLLMLPAAHLQPLPFIDALFTATSAICVTGLLTVNVHETFTPFGQAIIFTLIQLGGLGIMTSSTIFMLLLGKAISMRDTTIVYGSFASAHQINVRRLTLAVFTLMLVFEALGALAFTLIWMDDIGFRPALWAGVFHAASAFCNAGISTFRDGFIGMEKHPLANIVCIILIIAGVTGFMTVAELYHRAIRRDKKRVKWSFQTRIIGFYTFILLVIGFIGFLAFEWNNTLADRPLSEQILAAFFHSASGRTAGFSNIDPSSLNNTTLYLFIIMMFIGGAPGSVAGGIKITTFAILIGMAVSRYRGHDRVHIFNHAVPEQIVSRSIAVVFLSIIVLTSFMTLLLITESPDVSHPSHARGDFLEVAFEAASAYGTVGASMGITHTLSGPGKFLIIMLMLIGRLGPLTVAMAVSTGERRSAYQLSEETVMVG